MVIKNPVFEMKFLNVFWEERYISMEETKTPCSGTSALLYTTGGSLHHESSLTLAALCALWKEHPSVVTSLTTSYDSGGHCRGYVTVECISNACR